MTEAAPSARPSMAAASPTGPRPVIEEPASRPETSSRSSASYAVPNPHETRAPSTKDSDSGSERQVRSSASRKSACPPSRCQP